MGAVQGDGRPGSEEPGTGFGREESASRIAGQDHADAGAVTASPRAGAPDPTTGPAAGSVGVPEQKAASTVGVGATSSASAGTWVSPGAPAQAGSAPAPGPPYQSTEPYPAPSISRRSRRGSSWAAPDPTRTHRWGLGAFLLAWSVFLAVAGLVGVVVKYGGLPRTAGTLLIALVVPAVLAVGTALLITRRRGNGPRIDLRLGWSWRDLGMGLAFGFGGLTLTIPASIVYIAIVGEDATSAVGDQFRGIRAGPVLAILVLVAVVFVAPICEEIIFRGLLWGGIEKIAGRWVALPVSTLIFAIAHFELVRTPLLIIVAIPIALARLYTGRLLASIVAHQVNNLLPGIALMLGLLGLIPMP